jgi:hypothetical protein
MKESHEMYLLKLNIIQLCYEFIALWLKSKGDAVGLIALNKARSAMIEKAKQEFTEETKQS